MEEMEEMDGMEGSLDVNRYEHLGYTYNSHLFN